MRAVGGVVTALSWLAVPKLRVGRSSAGGTEVCEEVRE